MHFILKKVLKREQPFLVTVVSLVYKPFLFEFILFALVYYFMMIFKSIMTCVEIITLDDYKPKGLLKFKKGLKVLTIVKSKTIYYKKGYLNLFLTF